MLINLAPFQIKFKPMTVENCFLYIEGLNLDKKGEKKINPQTVISLL